MGGQNLCCLAARTPAMTLIILKGLLAYIPSGGYQRDWCWTFRSWGVRHKHIWLVATCIRAAPTQSLGCSPRLPWAKRRSQTRWSCCHSPTLCKWTWSLCQNSLERGDIQAHPEYTRDLGVLEHGTNLFLAFLSKAKAVWKWASEELPLITLYSLWSRKGTVSWFGQLGPCFCRRWDGAPFTDGGPLLWRESDNWKAKLSGGFFTAFQGDPG